MKSVSSVALLLFVSGACALVFQTAWFREFRLIFGASTPASAAVLAIFMAGLGLGNALLGKRADATANPLRLYAWLELSISLLCAASPLLLSVIRSIYIAAGGQETLGLGGATLARAVGSILVLGVPTFLMGGTLPAAARAVTSPRDASRRDVGLLYGLNTLGAVLGTLLSTFVLLEQFGTRGTLWMACGVNFLNGLAAWTLSLFIVPLEAELGGGGQPHVTRKAKRGVVESAPVAIVDASPTESSLLPAWAWYFAAGAVGCVFFLMELVWYRMLGPLLGGSTFTFGLILAVALAGIGIGGALYPLIFRDRRPDLRTFILTLGWEALALGIPFALGDRLAILAAVLRPLAYYGFAGQMFGWIVITLMVVFPAAFISGVQFPVLIALIGQGRQDVGKELGQAFGWNTLGAMLGSLAGGFGLLSLLSATGVWKLAVVALCLLAVVLVLVEFRRRRELARVLLPMAVLALAALTLGMTGPTAVWRHSGIGAGRFTLPRPTRNDLRGWTNSTRRHIVWQGDGRESAVAISAQNGAAFLVNGKSDGNAITDAGTQIMLGALGGLLHPDPRDGLVIGLGTGESAGWMAHLPSVERVDVIELEPLVQEMADLCEPLNHNVLAHPKVRLVVNDAREQLQTTRRTYDLIASEPSNPYRSGVASLYTREFYQSVRQRLKAGGLFLQWLQAYEIDAATIRLVLATLGSVFPNVEIWQTQLGDLVLVCSVEPLEYTAADLQARIVQPGLRDALRIGWRTTTVEGVLSHLIAGDRYARAVAAAPGLPQNTDDRNLLEYAVARTVGREAGMSADLLYAEAVERRVHRPERLADDIDWPLVEELRLTTRAAEAIVPVTTTGDDRGRRVAAIGALRQGDFSGTVRHWDAQSAPPRELLERLLLALAQAEVADVRSPALIDEIRPLSPLDAEALAAILAVRQGKSAEAAEMLVSLFGGLRTDPTPLDSIIERALVAADEVATKDASLAAPLFDALSQNFSLFLLEQRRVETLVSIGRHLGGHKLAAAIELFEPFPPWNLPMLELRAAAYQQVQHRRTRTALRELAQFRAAAPETAILSRKP
jgi:spermidine synthase